MGPRRGYGLFSIFENNATVRSRYRSAFMRRDGDGEPQRQCRPWPVTQRGQGRGRPCVSPICQVATRPVPTRPGRRLYRKVGLGRGSLPPRRLPGRLSGAAASLGPSEPGRTYIRRARHGLPRPLAPTWLGHPLSAARPRLCCPGQRLNRRFEVQQELGQHQACGAGAEKQYVGPGTKSEDVHAVYGTSRGLGHHRGQGAQVIGSEAFLGLH
jgi:hypothetical protein